MGGTKKNGILKRDKRLRSMHITGKTSKDKLNEKIGNIFYV
jgi:hypothetical protein